MLKKLHLSIVSPEKSIFDGDVSIVTLPGTLSYTLEEGGEEHTLDIQGGFVEMSDNTASVCIS